MRTGAVINVSYCAAHRKTHVPPLHGQLHAEWLEKCVDNLLKTGLPVVVSMTGWPGLLNVNVSPDNLERDVMWRVYAKTRFVTVKQDMPHQLGAAWNIRQGLEFAAKMGYDYMIHTAEDVVPHPGKIQEMVGHLERGVHYVCSDWSSDRADELNTEFFGCRVHPLVNDFNPYLLGGGLVERYLYDLLRGKRLHLYKQRPYDTSHDYDQWLAMLSRVERQGP